MKAYGIYFKVITLILILAAFVYGGYYLMRKADIAMPTLFQPAPGSRLLISMEHFRFTRSENGRVAWRMTSRSADLYENKEARLQDIEIIFKNPDDKEAALRGETGIMDTTSGNVSIRRGTREVRVVTSDGYLLTTDSLFWNAGERKVWTSDAFKLLGNEIYLEGMGLSGDVDMQRIVVKDNVKAVLQE
ncbi:MAG TPA: LPS export ABC transporter periplasmic protein LptC [Nitrospirota bacterium]